MNDGVVTAVGLGKATITATANAAPNLTATCEVTVRKLDKVDFSGLVYNADGEAYWSDVTSDAPEQWTAVHGAEGALISGAALDDLIFAHDGDHLYAIDADTFEIIQDCGAMAETWLWFDAAPALEMDDMFGKVLGLCYGSTMIELVGLMDGTLSYWGLYDRTALVNEISYHENHAAIGNIGMEFKNPTAKDASGKDVASTNGLPTVTYDPEALEVKSVHIATEYRAMIQEPGKITFAYANSQALEEVGTVTFVQKVSCPVSIQVQTLEVNEAKSGYVDARIIDHAWSQWIVTREPDCFYDGEQTHTCRVCGETETEVLPKNDGDCPSKQFTDLNIARWYHAYTDYVIGAGLMNGVGNNRFAPDATLTRGMLVTTLYRLAKEPEVTGTTSFTDLRKGAYYEKAVAWAKSEGIVKGVTDTLFAPDAPVTRERAATVLYRYVTEYLEAPPAAGGDLSVLQDAGRISNYAKAPVAWAVAKGFLEGYGNGILGPAIP